MNFDVLARKSNAGRSERGMRMPISALNKRGGNFLEKFKLASGEGVKDILPFRLELPFNPFDPLDSQYSEDYPFYTEGAVTTFISLYEKFLQENPEILKMLEERLGLPEGAYDVFATPPAGKLITKFSFDIYKNFVQPCFYVAPIVSDRLNPSVNKFGRKSLNSAELDEYGTPVKKDIFYMIYELENSIAQVKIDAINAKFSPGGECENGTDEEKKAEIKAAYKNMLVSRPYNSGVMITLAFALDPVKLSLTEASSKEVDKGEFDRHTYRHGFSKADQGTFDTIKSRLDYEEGDSLNYCEIDITVPMAPDGKPYTPFEVYGNRKINDVIKRRIQDSNPTFEAKLIEFLNTTEKFSESFVFEKIREFRKVRDEVICADYASALPSRKKYISAEIAAQHAFILEKVNSFVGSVSAVDELDSSIGKNIRVSEDKRKSIISVDELEDNIPFTVENLGVPTEISIGVEDEF